jgi:hypothetical protein
MGDSLKKLIIQEIKFLTCQNCKGCSDIESYYFDHTCQNIYWSDHVNFFFEKALENLNINTYIDKYKIKTLIINTHGNAYDLYYNNY